MERLFVPYEIALKLKELGMDEPCFAFFDLIYGKRRFNVNGPMCYYQNTLPHFVDGLCTAPLYQQVIDWLMGKLKNTETPYLSINIHSDYSGSWDFSSQPEIEYKGKTIYFKNLEEAIKQAIKLI